MQTRNIASLIFAVLILLSFSYEQEAEGAVLALDKSSYTVGAGGITSARVECVGCVLPLGGFLEISTFDPAIATAAPKSIQVFNDPFAATLTISGVSLGATTLQVALYNGASLVLFVRSNISVVEGAPCPVSLTLKEDVNRDPKLELLRDFRDNVMAENEEGREYIEIFYDHSLEASWLLMRYPRLRRQALEVLDNVMPVIESAVEDGTPVVLTTTDIADIEDLLDSFAVRGSPELQNSIRRLRSDLRHGKLSPIFGIEVEGSR